MTAKLSTTPGDVDSPGVTSDLDRARRLAGTFRRIHHVEITGPDGARHGVVHGVGHRLPVARRIPLSVAFDLARLGIPLVRRHPGES